MLPWLALRSEQPLELFQTPARAAVRFGWLLGFSFCCPAALTARGHRSAAAKQRTASKSDYNAQRCDIWSPAARIHRPSSSTSSRWPKKIDSRIRPSAGCTCPRPCSPLPGSTQKKWVFTMSRGQTIGPEVPWGNAARHPVDRWRKRRVRGAHRFAATRSTGGERAVPQMAVLPRRRCRWGRAANERRRACTKTELKMTTAGSPPAAGV